MEFKQIYRFLYSFLRELEDQFSKYIKISNYNICYIDCILLDHIFIYSLKVIKLKIFKIYMKSNLINNFIDYFIFFIHIFIFFYKVN